MPRTWKVATAQTVEKHRITFSGNGFDAPAYMSVTSNDADFSSVVEGDTLLVMLDSDEYPIALHHGTTVIWTA